MNALSRFFRKLAILFSRDRFRGDLADEMAFHREQAERELIASGASPVQAHTEAARRFGNTTRLRERSSELVGFSFETILQDLRFSLRQLARKPSFAFTGIFVLALGVGVSLAIFAFVDAALLEPLPYADPNRLMQVNEGNAQSPNWPLSYLDYQDWKRLNHSFRSLDIYGWSGYLLSTPSGSEPVRGMRVSGGFFQTLGVRPVLGRDFNAGEDRIGGPNVVLLSYGAWVHRFGARGDLPGQTIDLDGTAYTVIGVLPREFDFASAAVEFWVPINRLSFHEQSRTFYPFTGVGRLRDGASAQSAQAEMQSIAAELQKQFPIVGREASARVIPLAEAFIGDVRPILLTLLGGAGLLLLIACVNVANLLLVRSESRRREIAVRGALGATTARLIRQFVTEGLLLAGLGCAAGLLIAAGLMRVLAHLVPKDMAANMPFLEGVHLNVHTSTFAAAIALIAALLFAATPALRLSFQSVRDGLADGGRGVANRLWARLGANLVIVELSIAVVLLAGAGLLAKSLYRLLHVPLGFEPSHVATLSVMAPAPIYQTNQQVVGLYREIVRRVSNLPGAQAAGLTSLLPVDCDCGIDRISFPGRPYHGEHNDVDERHISPSYLPTLGARLIRGRFFSEDDDASHPGVAVINQSLARMYFPGQDPIGQRIADDEGGRPSIWLIVGLIEDVREGPLDTTAAPAEYFPISQTPQNSFSLAVRTSQEPAAFLPALVTAIRQVDPNLGVSDEATMGEKIGVTQAALLHRFSAWLVGGFAVLALMLGVVGLYGAVAYSVSQRTREIGVRMALGAQRSSVLWMILCQAGWLTAAGLAVGLAGSLAVSLLIRKLLFGVAPWDGMTLAGVVVLLGLASLAAGFLPARRAASVSPAEALRAE